MVFNNSIASNKPFWKTVLLTTVFSSHLSVQAMEQMAGKEELGESSTSILRTTVIPNAILTPLILQATRAQLKVGEDKPSSSSTVTMKVLGEELAYTIDQQLSYKLISADSYGFQQRENAQGLHPVVALGGLHFKLHTAEPLQPGIETALYCFHQRLGGGGLAPTTLIRLTGIQVRTLPQEDKLYPTILHLCQTVNKSPEVLLRDNPDLLQGLSEQISFTSRDCYLQVAQSVQGLTLEAVIQQHPAYQLSNMIDHDSFSRLVLGGLMTNPTDAKPSNFIVEDNTGRLVGIDNDQALAATFTSRHGKHYPGPKNSLYLMDALMQLPVSTTVAQHVRATAPLDLLTYWVEDLQLLNEQYAAMLNETEQAELGIPIRLQPGTLSTLLSRLEHLHGLLSQPLTHREVFTGLEPILQLYYQVVAKNSIMDGYNRLHNPEAVEAIFNVDYRYHKNHTLAQALIPYTQDTWDYYEQRTQSLNEAWVELMELRKARHQDILPLPPLRRRAITRATPPLLTTPRGLTLTQLDLSRESLLDMDLNYWRSYPALTTLILTESRFSLTTQAALWDQLPTTLTFLNIAYTKAEEEALLQDTHVAILGQRVPGLQTMIAGGQGLTSQGSRQLLNKLPQLMTLDLSHSAGGKGIIKGLQHHHYLQDLDLSHNKLDDTDNTALLQAIIGHPSLRILKLRVNLLTEVSGNAWGNYLLQSNLLTSLNLDNNRLGQGVDAISKSLKHNKSLTSLQLSRNGIPAKSLVNLAKALKDQTTLQQVDITRNTIDDAIRKAFTKTSKASLLQVKGVEG